MSKHSARIVPFSRLICSLILAAACIGRRPSAPGPAVVKDQSQAADDSDYVASCQHRPGAPARLYGCAEWAHGVEPLYVLNGQMLPSDSLGPGRVAREAALATAMAGAFEILDVFQSGDSLAAMKRYGADAARRGVFIITTPQPPPQAPAGYHIGTAVTLPDSLSEVMLRGRFHATVRRTERNDRERQMLAAAEQYYPNRETLLAATSGQMGRDPTSVVDTARLGRGHVDSTRVTPRVPGTPADRWWTYDFDGTWVPFAATGQAVQYYLERLRDVAAGRGQFRNPGSGTFDYAASVDPTHEGGASYVVRLRMSWQYSCGSLCGMGFTQTREVWFDANGAVLRLTGDGRPHVIVE
jgi:hypothetical protein